MLQDRSGKASAENLRIGWLYREVARRSRKAAVSPIR
jgi:hypothetical protein